jgi:hypothetical protein
MLRFGLAVLAYLALFGIWGMQLGESCLHLNPSFDTNVIGQLSKTVSRATPCISFYCRINRYFIIGL